MVKIRLSDKAYEKLAANKNGKSFSEIIIELIENKKRKKICIVKS